MRNEGTHGGPRNGIKCLLSSPRALRDIVFLKQKPMRCFGATRHSAEAEHRDSPSTSAAPTGRSHTDIRTAAPNHSTSRLAGTGGSCDPTPSSSSSRSTAPDPHTAGAHGAGQPCKMCRRNPPPAPSQPAALEQSGKCLHRPQCFPILLLTGILLLPSDSAEKTHIGTALLHSSNSALARTEQLQGK